MADQMTLETRLQFTSATIIVAIIGVVAVATIILCNGHFIYSLDDPYISLALGWHISHGLYGLNQGEAASPSSSILYPFLLAGFAWSSWQEWIPALVNTMAAAGTAALFAAIIFRSGIATRPAQFGRTVFLVVVLCVAINIVGIVFTGLEHSLHALTSVAIVLGLARVLESNELPVWLVPAIVLAPLWRFEGLALAGGAACVLLFAGQKRAAILALSMIILTIGGYIIAMRTMGLPALPSSVLIKSTLIASSQTGSLNIGDFLGGIFTNLYQYKQSVSLLALMLLILLHPLLRTFSAAAVRGPNRLTLPREYIFAGMLFGALLAHVLFGSWGWFYRYEVYAVAFGTAGAILLWRGEIMSLLDGGKPWLVTLAVSAALLMFNIYYVRGTIQSPLASRGIYEQQYQMHRFATEFYNRPVAVNDLGWVTYRNSNYVLDLWGLGSEAARKARLVTKEPGWMDHLAQEHHVGVALLYASWFGDAIPQDWFRLGRLRLLHETVSAGLGTVPGDGTVTIYSTSPAATPDALVALRRFADAVGPGVHVDIFAPPVLKTSAQ